MYALPLARFLLLTPPAWMTSPFVCSRKIIFFGLNVSVLGSINSNCGIIFATHFACHRTTCVLTLNWLAVTVCRHISSKFCNFSILLALVPIAILTKVES
jgi:hypothetical protein